MRLKLFNRIPYLWALVFAIALGLTQLLEHTPVGFVLCTITFTLVATTAFNVADGLTTLPGVYIFANAVLTCLLGITTKALLGQPATSNLLQGVNTMQLEVIGMLGMLVAVAIEKTFRARRPVLPTYLALPSIRPVFLASAALGVFFDIFFIFTPTPEAGTLLSVLHRVNAFTSLAILLGTIDTVQRSQGRRSLSPLTAVLILFGFAEGLVGFQKQSFFTAPATWVVALFVADYRLKIWDWVVIAVMLLVVTQFAVPYSQWGRNLRAEGPAYKSIPLSIYLLENFSFVRSEYQQSFAEESEDNWSYFAPMRLGLLERLTMLPPDDSLIEVTDRQGTYGYAPLNTGIEALVPTVLWHDKPPPQVFGNIYAHEIGRLQDEDNTTGISFNITADAYHEGGLPGVLLVEPLVLTCLFLLLSYVMGKTGSHPLTAILALIVLHGAPEDALWTTPSMFSNVTALVVLAAACRYVLPVFGNTLEAPSRWAKSRGRRGTRVVRQPEVAVGRIPPA